ncbi:MAG TPA: carboxypeptidase-like regulatory domain-containing protein [Gemmatimonadaceae bacterium]|nr:carboxypeptidase-like regulatory domain-containing protein [Gemmatimonadaceae bacterium]
MLALLVVFQTTVGAIGGAVVDTMLHPVHGVTVGIISSTLSAVTDSAGHFRLNNVPVGQQVVFVGHVAKRVEVKADTVVPVLLVARDIPAPKMVWLGCKPFGTCSQMRYVATFRQHDIPAGVGVIRDAATWSAFLSRHATGPNAAIRDDIIDWTHEMLVIVCDAGINRVDRHPDRVTVLLGPDSVSGASNPLGAAMLATVVAVKRTTLPVEYKAILQTTHVPPTVDWSGQ